jgi:hypothetical protein
MKVLQALFACLLTVGIVCADEPTLDAGVTTQFCVTSPTTAITIITATVNLMELTPGLDRFDVQVWEDGVFIMQIPATTENIDVSGLQAAKFRLVDRTSGESVLLIRPDPFIRLPCTTLILNVSLRHHSIWINFTEWSYEVPVPRRVGGER